MFRIYVGLSNTRLVALESPLGLSLDLDLDSISVVLKLSLRCIKLNSAAMQWHHQITPITDSNNMDLTTPTPSNEKLC